MRPQALRTRTARLLAGIALVHAFGTVAGCSDPGDGTTPTPDYAMFEADVYPVLLRDCAFSECHGHPSRFFQAYGPGRTRLDPATEISGPVTPREIQVSYERARSMLTTAGPVEESLLLVKPLEQKSGGAGHRGVDAFGRNVYASKQEPSYQTLLSWAKTKSTTLPPPSPGQLPMAGTSP